MKKLYFQFIILGENGVYACIDSVRGPGGRIGVSFIRQVMIFIIL